MAQSEIKSKVLVHEIDTFVEEKLRNFFEQNNLMALKTSAHTFMNIMIDNTDLGAVFISENCNIDGYNGVELAKLIHRKRPEVPVFYRTENKNEECMKELSECSDQVILYDVNDQELLKQKVNERIFTNYYPIQLIQGVQEISTNAFQSIFKDTTVKTECPLLVNDHIIYGELFSLIPLESNWCRGTMTLQTTQFEMLELIKIGKTHLHTNNPDFRDLNDILNELTNMIWGGLKSDFFTNAEKFENISTLSQVPILVNHQQKYISFGTREPQLCFKYILENDDDPRRQFTIFQKFIFNLSWKPEDFKPVDKSADDMIESGELEFF